MKLSLPLKKGLVELVCYLFILLFVYAAVSKLLEFHNFQAQLGQSPLLSAYTGTISIVVPAIEILISLLLAVPRFRFWAMVFSFSLMILFTSYIVIILTYSSYVPCSCGGILEKMGWSEHLAFNIIFTLLAVLAIFMMSSMNIKMPKSIPLNPQRVTLGLMAITFISIASIVLLYATSESLMHKKNPFVRRFIQGTSAKDGEMTLPNNSYYFAGIGNGKLYLANSAAPLYITVVDTTLGTKQRYKIQLDNYNYPFRSVQVRVDPPFFYVMDGTVPVIFKGAIKDWSAKATMRKRSHYFSGAEIVNPDELIIRTENNSHEHLLANLEIGDSAKVIYKPTVLQKQIDGFFDSDGIMQYDAKSKRFVYLYFYRNQFIVTDSTLSLLYRGKTIDTISRAKLKVAHIKKLGERKLAAPPYIVNIQATLKDNFLFVNSAIRGNFEDENMWKEASVVDVYDINENAYISSIYIYDAGKLKMNNMIAYGSNLYVLLGYHLHKYKLKRSLQQKPN